METLTSTPIGDTPDVPLTLPEKSKIRYLDFLQGVLYYGIFLIGLLTPFVGACIAWIVGTDVIDS